MYERLWRPTIGRPWTYAMRQWRTQYPVQYRIAFVLSAAAFSGGIVATGLLASWTWATVVAGAGGVLGAEIHGHLFWDTRGAYIKHSGEFK